MQAGCGNDFKRTGWPLTGKKQKSNLKHCYSRILKIVKIFMKTKKTDMTISKNQLPERPYSTPQTPPI
jgi:hypothetical protein